MKANNLSRHIILWILMILMPAVFTYAQKNLSLAGSLSYTQNLSDIWGYVDSTGNEYAIVGTYTGVSIVDVTNPAASNELFFYPGPHSTWRDIKVWNGYAFIINETDSPLQIINLTNLPSSSATKWWLNGVPGFTRAHNIYIDEKGYAYIFGSNVPSKTGALILDVDTDPWNPVYVGYYGTAYLHDGYVRNDTMWGGEINQGRFSVVDVSNPASTNVLATESTPNNFTHNTWLSDDSKTLFTTDEKGSAYIASYDVSNLSNITELDRYQSNPGSNVIPHNTHVLNDFLITSYYRDGVTIVDGNKPDNLVEIGYYDTAPTKSGYGFNGCWGAYPFLPSGNILASDIENGLFILTPQYVRACYIIGNITNALTTNPINNVQVDILTTAITTTSDIMGDYKSGVADSGSYDITFSKIGYLTKTIYGVNLDNGIETVLDVQLNELTTYPVTGKVINASDGTPIENATVLVTTPGLSFNTTSDNLGNFNLSAVYGGYYSVYAAKWGYITNRINNQLIDSTTGAIVIQIADGVYDDFYFDFGWSVSGTPKTGTWERGEPILTTYGGYYCNPGDESLIDFGDVCYITGNSGGSAGNDDVDSGKTVLTSPVFDLSGYTEPYLSYNRWFFVGGGSSSPNDSLTVKLTDGTTTVILESLDQTTIDSATYNTGWKNTIFRVSDYLTPDSTMQVIFEAEDQNPGHLVEAGLDLFRVTDSSKYEEPPFMIFTSPADGDTGVKTNAEIMIVFSKTINRASFEYSCTPDPNGWILKWNDNSDTLILQHNDFNGTTTYTVKIIAAKDFYGNGIVSSSVANPWSFNTAKSSGTEWYYPNQNQVSYFPNPFLEKITFLLSISSENYDREITLALYNVLGLEVKSLNIDGTSMQSDPIQLVLTRGQLLPGVYMFKLSMGNIPVSIGKVIVQE